MAYNAFVDSLFIYSSGLQKSIRRAEVENALFFAYKLITECTNNNNAVLKKLLTCLMEDIWFANPVLWYDLHRFIKNENRKVWAIKNEALLKLVVKFTLSPKNREVDNCIFCHNGLKYDWDNDFFKVFGRDIMYLDSDNFKSKARAKNTELLKFVWYPAEGVRNDYLDNLYLEYNEEIKTRLEEYWFDMPLDFAEILSQLALELKNIGLWKDYVQLYYTFFYLFSKNKDVLLKNFENNFPLKDEIDLSLYNYKANREIPDYVYDKHTSKWRSLKRWFNHFFRHSAVLNGKIHVLDDFYEKMIYCKKGFAVIDEIDKRMFPKGL